jgi:hypothetical protein
MASNDLVFGDENAARAAFAEVRSNESAINWCLFTYSDSKKNTLELVGTGSGGIEELKQHLDESKMFYGLLRVKDVIDQSVTVKFVFIIWCGEKVGFVQKGKMTTHKGSISSLMGQYHNDHYCSNLSEISEEIIISKVRDASGTAVHVKEAVNPQPQTSSVLLTTPAAAAATTSGSSPSSSAFRGSGTNSVARSGAAAAPKTTPGVPQAATVVQFADEDALRAAIRNVRDDKNDNDWVLMGYEGNTNKVVLAATGDQGLEQLISHLEEDKILYGFYRTTDTVDNTVAVKFVLILWVGEKVPIIRKARITTHKGEITSFIGQYHVDCSCSNLHEINDEIITDLVRRASGTANYVK